MIGRVDYSEDTEALINQQIGLEMQASHNYRDLSAHFSHPSVAYPGLAAFFRHNSEEEKDHAQKFIDFQNARCGTVVIPALRNPMESFYGTMGPSLAPSPLSSLEYALYMERGITEVLIKIQNCSDNQTEIFLDPFIEEQTKSLAEISALVTQLSRVHIDPGHLYIFDRELASRYSK